MKLIVCYFIQFIFLHIGYAQSFKTSKQEDLRREIQSALYVPDQLPELNSKLHSTFEPCSGVVAERVSYITTYNLEVPGILYLPKPRPAGKIPALVIVNGHGGDKYSWYSYYAGMMYAKGGAAVLTYDQIGEGERNINHKSGTRAHDVYEDPPELAHRLGGLMMADVLQAVSFLSEREEIDENKIAALGHSMGSFVLSLAGAVETRLNSVVLVGGGNLDGVGGYWDTSKPMCQGIPYQSLTFLDNRPEVIYGLHSLRGPLLIYNGLQDSIVAIPMLGTWSFFDDLYDRTSKLVGGTAELFDYNFIEGGHRPYFLTKPVAVWLEKHLDFPNWTEAEITSMSVTHISQWAKENKLKMDPGYANELHGGGTMALGTGVPVIARDSFNVFPLKYWEENKDKFIYESWLRNAKSELETK